MIYLFFTIITVTLISIELQLRKANQQNAEIMELLKEKNER
ncbi:MULTISPECIES: hypothetical protein [Sutcliffiella]|nr:MULTISPECIES: hypothetical protein [Sutcliffiella]MED4018874.1 hypothetical protein [Sutcliffiella cohnii]WBL17084.1 hypothetical protein O1A01_10810 [Sutcliffiella sp. NC1]